MKKLYPFLMLILVNLSFSQDARIFENNWYLRNVIVNGVNNYPPNADMSLNFMSFPTFYAMGCTGMFGTITFENNNANFSATDYNYSLEVWSEDIPTQLYQDNIYFPFFYTGSFPDPTTIYNFTYNITEFESVRTLTISSIDNKQAVYSNVMLANKTFDKAIINFYPNPFEDYLEIKLQNDIITNSATVEIYNGIGLICKTVQITPNLTRIETKNLSSGIYFVKIKTKNETVIKKLIKK